AGLEPRVALPRARVRDEVILERGERGCERSAVPEGPQPHVDAKCLPVPGRLREERDERAAHRREKSGMGEGSRAARLALRAVQEDEVHVGGNVELRAAELAERGDDER